MWRLGICACGGVCERETEKTRLRSNMEPPFLWHLWQMARPFEEQSTAIDIKLPALKTEGPAQPHLFTVSQNCLNCLSGNKCRICAPFIHNVGQCLPAKSITSHSGAVGDSVMSTLIPPKSGTTSWEQHYMLFSYESQRLWWLLLAWREWMEGENRHAEWWRQTWQRRFKP